MSPCSIPTRDRERTPAASYGPQPGAAARMGVARRVVEAMRTVSEGCNLGRTATPEMESGGSSHVLGHCASGGRDDLRWPAGSVGRVPRCVVGAPPRLAVTVRSSHYLLTMGIQSIAAGFGARFAAVAARRRSSVVDRGSLPTTGGMTRLFDERQHRFRPGRPGGAAHSSSVGC